MQNAAAPEKAASARGRTVTLSERL